MMRECFITFFKLISLNMQDYYGIAEVMLSRICKRNQQRYQKEKSGPAQVRFILGYNFLMHEG